MEAFGVMLSQVLRPARVAQDIHTIWAEAQLFKIGGNIIHILSAPLSKFLIQPSSGEPNSAVFSEPCYWRERRAEACAATVWRRDQAGFKSRTGVP